MANSTQLFQALGDRTRRKVFERLRGGPRAVVELSRGLRVSRPAVSQHLKVLKKAGLVTVRREGTRHFYQIEPSGIEAVRDYIDQFWNEALEAFKQHAEKKGNPQP